MSASSSLFGLFCIVFLVLAQTNALALRSEARSLLSRFSAHSDPDLATEQSRLAHSPPGSTGSVDGILRDLIDALNVMQNDYFELWQGKWPTSIDWTAAVLGTHVSASLESLSSTQDDMLSSALFSKLEARPEKSSKVDVSQKAAENLVNHFFSHTTSFYYGEDAFSLRNQAFDDMLWVVLGWLENIKLQVLHSDLHYNGPAGSNSVTNGSWHGIQFKTPAAHRARIFYDLASAGWDTKLCGGGMVWNQHLAPYKNAITNELYISASIAMYLYFPGDVIDSPFMAQSASSDGYPHNHAHLQAAIDGYRWLNSSGMTGDGGLYADGFHINGWKDSGNPGTGKCDVLNSMIYTYNQGVVLSGARGLWLATASEQYLRDGHELIHRVIQATGWPDKSSRDWKGLGRGGVLEDSCDSSGSCSQDGQSFKGIFFHHMAEFCRTIRPQEARFLASANVTSKDDDDWQRVYEWHQSKCQTYRPWIEHNAKAALVTRTKDGKFGMWWGKRYRSFDKTDAEKSPLPPRAIDYRNVGDHGDDSDSQQAGELHHSHTSDIAPQLPLNGNVQRPELHGGRYDDLRRSAKTSNQTQQAAGSANNDNKDYNDRGRGRTVETQAGGVAVLRALHQWQTATVEKIKLA